MQTHCARGAGHPLPCASPEAMQRQRQRTAASRPLRVITPEDRARWNRTYKLKIKGLTRERFQAMLEAQDYACAMCREPFGEDQTIFADHDHACCPGTRSCGKCLRGLLCLTCNVAVGYVETYGDVVRAYLSRPGRRSPLPGGLR
jgi:Recombination endonuclease VII